MKNKLYNLSSLIIIILIVSSCSMEYYISRMEKPKESVVSYLGRTHPTYGHSDNEWEFHDENKRRHIITGVYDERGIGTKYVIYYDSINTEIYYVDVCRPIIYPNESVITLPFEISKDKKIYPNQIKEVDYIFYFGTEKINAYDCLRANINDTIILKKGDRFLVDVCKSNPDRTIIHLDKPISDRRPLKEYTRIFTDSVKHHHNHTAP